MKIYKFVRKYLKINKLMISVYIFTSLIVSLTSLVTPYLTGTFIDNLMKYPYASIIYKFTYMVITVSVIQLFLSYVTAIISIKLKTKLSYFFNKDIVTHLQRVSILFLNNQNIAYLNQQINADCANLINFTLAFLNGIIVTILTFIICFIVIIRINIAVSILIFFLIIAYIILYVFMNTPLSKIILQEKEMTATYLSAFQEQLSKIYIIKIFNLFDYFNYRMDKHFEKLLFINIKNTKLAFIFQSSDIIIKTVSQITLFLIGGFQILRGELTIGAFTILSTYFLNLIASTKTLINLYGKYIDTKVSAKRLIKIIEIKNDSNGKQHIENINYIKVQNLTFRYDYDNVLSAFNYTFEKEKIYQICGQNGKGKSTLMNLLIGLYPRKYEGTITYNDVDVQAIDMNDLRGNSISYIGQNNLFFNGTIMDNLLMDSDIPKEKMERILNMFTFESYEHLNIDMFMNMEINDSNTNLSGGELKKIAIIRGLLKPCSLLILDEPTNSLDEVSKDKLKSILLNMKKNRIIILISHDEYFDSIIDYKVEL